MSEKSPEIPERKMQVTADDARRFMRDTIRECAEPAVPGESLKVALSRAARRVGMSFNRLYDLYSGEALPRWHEGETIRREAERQRKIILERWSDLAARKEIAELRERLERLENHDARIAEDREMAPAANQDEGQQALDLCGAASVLDRAE